jgi:hypothetical protein
MSTEAHSGIFIKKTNDVSTVSVHGYAISKTKPANKALR